MTKSGECPSTPTAEPCPHCGNVHALTSITVPVGDISLDAVTITCRACGKEGQTPSIEPSDQIAGAQFSVLLPCGHSNMIRFIP